MRKSSVKSYYSAGLISIILLPVFCTVYLISIDAFTQYGALSLGLWDGKSYKKEFTQIINTKKFKIINLTGNADSDKVKLMKAQKDMRNIIFTKDSINGIKFHFEKISQYWSFVWVLDILSIEKARAYIVDKNDIWVFNPIEPKPNKNALKIKFYDCGYQPYTPTNEGFILKLDWKEMIEELKLNRNEIIVILKKFYLPLIAYLLMVFFTFKKLWLK